ncbi:hypothetical protein QBC33DRAFT_585666 [Phialemonium atrogriseum]|uniref:Aminoglycoside phosphotransferase domain-containing protein n=1 Tax=Phialemonium atrogriseum TaxID=1093897 RepID=A0AAJ0C4U2_9PEZI|nr:uncharacterized protein QBC33DRAFT_585666 [Phialemonium atrogriseum]KAK1767706.1 hypothetical protein QBC33DRAFT_585666 [Phialemonium atrogriseum]
MPGISMPAKRQKRNIFFHASFNLTPLLRLAERLRHQPSLNWTIFLEFDDGVEWVFRAPCSTYTAAQGVTGRLLASEAATLKYIREHTSIPVPEVFHYSHELSGLNSPATPARVLTEEEKGKIMRQLGCYARQLFSLRFPTIELLFERDEGYCIGECLSPGHVLQDRETIEDLPRRPFHHEPDYYSSLAVALLLHAEQLPMGHHVLRAPIPVPQEYPNFANKNRLQYSLASHLLRDSIIPCMIRPVSQSAPGFPLYRHDISLQNLFAFSSTVPPAHLLSTPGLPHPRDLEDRWMCNRVRLLEGRRDGLTFYAPGEPGCFTRLSLPGGALRRHSLPAILATRATTQEALELADELAADDEPKSEVRWQEKEYFDAVGAKRLALAHKVTLVAEMNSRFVADGRLWRWIDAVMVYYDDSG